MPDITFNCPHCQQSIEAPEGMVDTETECPTCHRAIKVTSKILSHKGTNALSKPESVELVIEFTDLLSAKCPSCGGAIRVLENQKSVTCGYCGNSVIIRKQTHGVQQTGEGLFNSEMYCNFCLAEGRYRKAFGMCVLCEKNCCTFHGEDGVLPPRVAKELAVRNNQKELTDSNVGFSNYLLPLVVDALSSEIGQRVTCENCFSSAATRVINQIKKTDPLTHEILSLIRSGNKIGAIKIYRARNSDKGLAESLAVLSRSLILMV